MKIAIIGLGHVGLVVAACMAKLGHEVTGVDLPLIVKALNKGKTNFYEPGLNEMVTHAIKEGRLRITTQLAEVANSQIIWVCISTNQGLDGNIHTNTIEQIVAAIGNFCSSHTIISLKSTLPIGACDRISKLLPNDGPILTNNPEFLRQGSAIYDFFNPGKTVVGSGPRGGADMLARLYESFPGSKIYTNWETAEMIKLSQNTFNALHISFMNELILTTEGLNISLELVSQALRDDISALRRYMKPGFSYGGSCLPSNVAYLEYLAQSNNYAAPLLHSIKTVNDLRISSLINKIIQEIKELKGRRITLWGLAYKAYTDDLRNSPSILLANALQDLGVKILVFDPFIPKNQVEKSGYIYCSTLQESLIATDALVILTACQEFMSISLETITRFLNINRIFDVVGILI